MTVSIASESLTVQIAALGAELQSVTGADGTQYLWYGDPRHWGGRAINLFPCVGRHTGGRYTWRGKTYAMDIHGFLKDRETEPARLGPDRACFTLREDADSLRQYPFPFLLEADYRLSGNRLHIRFSVTNTGTEEMRFSLGGHPGFRVPLEAGLGFEDYGLFFEASCRRVPLSDDGFILEGTEPFPLREGWLDLRHELFARDALILCCERRRVTLASPRGSRFVTLDHPDLPWLGVWQNYGTRAPFLCLEPWSGLPARKGVVEDLDTQPGLLALEAGQTHENEWTVLFG